MSAIATATTAAAVAASRRKQAKPQKVAGKEDSPVLNCALPEPLSIEEQFRQQLAHTLDRQAFLRTAHAHAAAAAAGTDEDEKETSRRHSPSPVNGMDLTPGQKITEVLEDGLAASDKSNLLLSGFAQFNQQQLLQLCAASLAGNKDLIKQITAAATVGLHPATTTLNPVPSPPALSLQTSAASPSGDYRCPVEECEVKNNTKAALVLHLSTQHRHNEKGGYLNCDSCGRCFTDLLEFRRHRCGSELPATRPQSVVPQGPEEACQFVRKTESAPGLPPWGPHQSIHLRNAEQQLNDVETASSSDVPASDDEVAPPTEPPLLLNELFGNLKQQHKTVVAGLPEGVVRGALDLSAKKQVPLLPGHSFLGGAKATPLLAPPLMATPTHPFDATSAINFTPPSASVTPSTSLIAEDDWESMMEISNIDENEKIRQLVGDKAAPPTDPNQCLLCRRVLSCKSALQMHYRTHTGERPFKCKICQRAFTTKGNLKTHMGVHRSKHSIRTFNGSLQQCPICSKRFLNSAQLNQHMAVHTRPPVSTCAAGAFALPPPPSPFHLFPHLLNFPGLPPGVPLNLSQTACEPQHHHQQHQQKGEEPTTTTTTTTAAATMAPKILAAPFDSLLAAHKEQQLPRTQLVPPSGVPRGDAKKQTPPPPSSSSSSSASSSSSSSSCSTSLPLPLPLSLSLPLASLPPTHSSPIAKRELSSQDRSPLKHKLQEVKSEVTEEEEECVGVSAAKMPRFSVPSCTTLSEDVKPSLQLIRCEEDEGANGPGDTNPLDAIQRMWKEAETAPAPRQPVTLSKHQCGVCFKHFSSSSALQIHMRTHTGDKPFKCTVCGRAFTTRGNLKVHMGTHSYTQSPSRRGRRIFDFGHEIASRQQGLPTMMGTAGGFPGLGLPLNFPPLLAAAFAAQQQQQQQQAAAKEAKELKELTAAAAHAPKPDPNANPMESVFWMLRTVCTICHKATGSPQELEKHLKTHLTGASETGSSSAIQLKSE